MEIENLYIILQIRTPYTISRFSILQFKYNTAFAIITVIENNVMSKQEDIYIYIYTSKAEELRCLSVKIYIEIIPKKMMFNFN